MQHDNPFSGLGSQADSDPVHSKGAKANTSERRRAIRQALESPIQVSFDTEQLKGVANNVSKSGVLFFTDGVLRVTVELNENGEKRKVTGNLVRCERIKGDHRGWAVEFDHE